MTHVRSNPVVMHPAWQRIETEVVAGGYSSVQDFVRQAMAKRLAKTSQESSTTNLTRSSMQTMQKAAFHPASSLLTWLDMLRCIFLFIDAIIVPFRIAWDEKETRTWSHLGLAALLFWGLDMFFNFRTGFLDDGAVVTDSLRMAKRYIKGGFLLDLGVLTSDALAFLHYDLGTNSSLRQLAAKSVRLLRVLIRLRTGLLNRIQTAVYHWMQVRSLSQHEHVVMMTVAFLKLLFVILCLCHIGSCSRKFVMQRLAAESLDESSLSGAEYLDSMYWTVSTMFSGAPPLVPASLPELWLALFWIIMGALFLTTVTSTLAARLIEFSETQQDLNRKVQMLTTFMGQKKTPIWLSLAISANFHKKLLAAEPVSERDLPFLHMVTPSLRAALREHQFESQFLQLPIFRMLSVLHPKLTRELCFASSCSIFMDAEDVFGLQQEMDHAFLLFGGLIRYSLRMNSIKEFRSLDSDMRNDVKAPHWFCELALFIKWRTRGTAQAEGACSVLMLSAELFINLITQHFNAAVVAAAFAKQLAKVFLARETEAFHRCSDLDPGVDTDVVVSSMHTLIRGGLLSLPALELLTQRYSGLWNRSTAATKGLLELEEEVLAGKCHLVLGPDGVNSINRVVRVAVLHLTDKSDKICAHLLQCVNGTATSQFHLPGCKVVGNESAEDTMQKFIREQLPGLAASIRMIDVETVIEMGASASYGISTKYIKTIHRATLVAEFIQERVSPLIPLGESVAPLDVVASTTSSLFGASSTLRKFRPGKSPARTLATGSEVSVATNATDCSTAEIAHPFLGAHARSQLFAVCPKVDNGVERSETPDEDSEYDHNMLHLYSWLEQAEFFRLRDTHQKEMEEAMYKYATRHFTVHSWQDFLAWHVRPCESDMETANPGTVAKRAVSRI